MGDAYEAYEEAADIRRASAEVRAMLLPPKVVWTDKQGKTHDPWKMSLSHLGNCIKLCERRGQEKAAKALMKIKTERENEL